MEPRAAIIKASFDIAHFLYSAVADDLDEKAARYSLPGATVATPLAILAHALYSEDTMLAMAADSPLVMTSGQFAGRTGIREAQPGMTPDWLASNFDLDGLREYGAAVFGRTNEFLASATLADMDRQVMSPLGQPTYAAEFLASIAVVHFSGHVGELSALKGAQGLKGLPF